MILDITMDLETTALCPTAAVLSLGAVAWNRMGASSPFFNSSMTPELAEQHYVHVDLRSSFLDGFTFDKDTADWWSKQSDDVKIAVLENDEECSPCLPIKNVILGFFEWIDDMKQRHNADEVCLWSQGSDFDIAILRNICYKYGITIPVHYTGFRDHRSYFLEGARLICELSGTEFNPKDAYKMVDEYEGKGAPHDPVFDCKRSIYTTWQMMNHLRCLGQNSAK